MKNRLAIPLKFLAFSSLISLIFSVCGVFDIVYAASFTDVSQDHPDYKTIEYLKTNDYVRGYVDSTFKPDNKITRAEAATIIVSGLKINTTGSYLVLFKDVLKTDWFFPYVMAAQKAGIVSGDKDGKFRPGDTVTKAEALSILSRAFKVGMPKVDSKGGNIFADVPPNVWFSAASEFAKEKNIVLMDDYGQVGITAQLTRGGFAELMYRFLIVKDGNWKEFPLDDAWRTYDSKVLPFTVKYPDDWQILKYVSDSGEGVSFWDSDKGYFQSFPERVYPNTAKFVVALDKNEEGLNNDQYFSNIKKIFSTGTFSNLKVSGFNTLQVSYEKDFIKDRYIYLDKGSFVNQVLAIYTQNGGGILSSQNRKFLDAILNSLAYNEIQPPSDKNDNSKLKSTIFENILIEDKGKEMVDLLPDKVIIKTDAIGVGTGPIDYYYSSRLDLTLKYERASDVILDYRNGQTSSF